MITVDGEAITPSPDGSNGEDEAVRLTRLDLKLCKALTALNPPHELSVLLHARITAHLRTLRRSGSTAQDTRQAADLDDDELRQGAAIFQATRALPFWSEKAIMGGPSYRTILASYALDLTDELNRRTGRNPQPQAPDPSDP